MKTALLILIYLALWAGTPLLAQYDAPLFTSYTKKEARDKMYERVIHNIILKNLDYPLSADTEENWENAFTAMEVFRYNSPFTIVKIASAFEVASELSVNFQRALLELAYTNYPLHFKKEVYSIMEKTINPRNFAMCAEYLMAGEKNAEIQNEISGLMFSKFRTDVNNHPILAMLLERLKPDLSKENLSVPEVLKDILQKDFLPGKIIMFSFQRPDRNYPGLTIFRDAMGNFVKDSTGNIIHIPQLARSITNLPFYLRNGNTPQGIYRMFGFGVSMSDFIGPTANVQMGMPWELSKKAFFDDSTLIDSTWTIENYQKLLPGKLKNYFPLFGSFYAGMIGRNEIITHGSTLNPELYANQPYYPLTPTLGCLTSMELWDGNRLESDQQKLVNGLLKAGGAKGYAVVIELLIQ